MSDRNVPQLMHRYRKGCNESSSISTKKLHSHGTGDCSPEQALVHPCFSLSVMLQDKFIRLCGISLQSVAACLCVERDVCSNYCIWSTKNLALMIQTTIPDSVALRAP